MRGRLSVLSLVALFASLSIGSLAYSQDRGDSEQIALRGAYSCNKLLASVAGEGSPLPQLQAVLVQLFTRDFPVFHSPRFRKLFSERISSGSRPEEDPDGAFRSFYTGDLSYDGSGFYLNRAEFFWKDLAHDIRTVKLPEADEYGLSPDERIQVGLLFDEIAKDEKLSEAMSHLIFDMYVDYGKVVDQQSLAYKQGQDARRGVWHKLHPGGDDLDTTFGLGMASAVVGAFAYFGGNVPLELLGTGFGALATLWHTKEIGKSAASAWNRTASFFRERSFYKNIGRPQLKKAAELKLLPSPTSVVVEGKDVSADSAEDRIRLWHVELKKTKFAESCFREIRPELTVLNFQTIDGLGASVESEARRLLVLMSSIRDEFRSREVWRDLGKTLNLEHKTPMAMDASAIRIFEAAQAYGQWLRDFQVQFDEGFAAVAQHQAYLRSGELRSLITSEADKSLDPVTFRKRIVSALVRVESRLRETEGWMRPVSDLIESELALADLLEAQASDAKRVGILSMSQGTTNRARWPEVKAALMTTIQTHFEETK